MTAEVLVGTTSAAAAVWIALARPPVVRRPTSPPAGPAARRLPVGSGLVSAAAIVAAVVVIGPPAVAGGLVLAVAWIGRRELGRRRVVRARDLAFPDLVDLFRIALVAGHPVARCLEVVAGRAPAPHRAPLEAAAARVEHGAPVADALGGAGPELGTLGPALVDALVSAHRDGAPAGGPLDQLARTARDRRTRAAEAEARRLPVTLLFPLVGCVLPAFVLLAVVPLLVGSFSSLRG